MNYYQFHVGDYAAHTRNLGLLEDLAYRRMLDAYYVNERPFVGGVQDVAREIGMREHIEDVEYVLNRFFVHEGDVWTNKRADAEIARWKSRGWFPSVGAEKRLRPDLWKALRLKIFERDGYRCVYCGSASDRLECDHINPVSRGGGNEEGNLATACYECNRIKSNRTIEEMGWEIS